MKLFLKISFLGTNYNGYQVQNNAPTVQRAMNQATERLFGFECDVVGCSRTDSGVHANEFCLTVSKKGENCLNHSVPISKIPIALNSLLPDDISVKYAEMVEDDFHARYDVKYKEYVYLLWNSELKNPFMGDRAYNIPFFIDDAVLDKMNRAADKFVGKHDFTAFMAKGSKITDAVRTVYYANLRREGDTVVFCVAADGFLYNMVRIMVGTLIDVARDNLNVEDLPNVIQACDRTRAGATAPPYGLYLNKVSYSSYEGE